MKKQPEVTQKTKRAFMDAFCELYVQKPIERISIQEITNRAGYNRSSFYQHFCDIYELLDYLENYVLDSMLEKLPADNAWLQGLLTPDNETNFYLKTLFGEFGSSHFIERLKASVPLDSHKTSISSDDPLAPYIMEFHLSTVLSLMRLWYQRDQDLSQAELSELTYRLYMGGTSALAAFEALTHQNQGHPGRIAAVRPTSAPGC
ncbi:MAG: TetR/AcrR family transcriptional regulator [Propionibacteriaceae bacterium]|jgi:AcrR family transcriptional regulator|nr:TetR/AcrR family transcriptional regulator [Propionibacteriaceae bacterium]